MQVIDHEPSDDELAQLVEEIIEPVAFTPPEIKLTLKAPKLRVVRGPDRVNSYCVRVRGGSTLIAVGSQLYGFCLLYARAAASNFLPSEPNGVHPSPSWSDARSAIASALDWLSSPAIKPVYSQVQLTDHQESVAREFAHFIFRFALCHELAHVALGHVESGKTEPTEKGTAYREYFLASQQDEVTADVFGLDLQMKSASPLAELKPELAPSLLNYTALASSIYFVHIAELLRIRLMLANRVIDRDQWIVEQSHPPPLWRVAELMGLAERRYGSWASQGLRKVHESLEGLDGEVREVAHAQQESVVESMLALLNEELSRSEAIKSGRVCSEQPSRAPKVMMDLFRKSPIGVLAALDGGAEASSPAEVHATVAAIVQTFAESLPAEFQKFHQMTRGERARDISGFPG